MYTESTSTRVASAFYAEATIFRPILTRKFTKTQTMANYIRHAVFCIQILISVLKAKGAKFPRINYFSC